MFKRKTYLYTFIFAGIVSILLISCNNKPAQKNLPTNAKITRPDKNVERLERELNKAKIFGIKNIKSYPYYYDTGEEKAGKMSEEITFDKKGNRIDHVTHKGNDVYDFKYEYDDNNRLLTMKSYNEDGDLLLEKKYIYDEQGRNTGINEVDHYSERNTKYYRFTYKDSLIVEKTIDNFRLNRIVDERIEYDTLGYKIADHKSDPNGVIVNTYYKHDEYGNLSEINAPYFKITFDYDDKGNVVNQELWADSTRQYKFVYDYDDEGLLLEKRRYDLKEKMVFKLVYKYEFF